MNDNSARTNQSGSVVSFLVVGVILAVVVIGGITLLQNRDQQTPTASPSASVSPAPSPSAGTSGSSNSPAPTPSKSPTASSAPVPSTNGTLPSTGPTDNLLSSIAGAILLGVIIAFVRSYRARVDLVRR